MSKAEELKDVLKDVDKSLAELIDIANKRQKEIDEYIKQLEERRR